jgi:hypothetical protein
LTVVVSTPPTPGAGPDDYQDHRPKSKTDQWICWWSILIFYNLFGLIFVVLTRVMPPPSPHLSTEQIVHFFQVHSLTIKIGFGLLMVVIGFSSWANGLVVFHMKRMSVGSVWAYSYIAALAVGALPGCLFAALCFLTAVFRPDRNPHIMALLYDMGLLMFVGSLGCFATMYLVFALAILLDKNKIFPKWLAYVTIWQIVTEVMAAPVFIFKRGPFSWNGSISFWQGTVIFVIWEVCVVFVLYKAIREQPPRETDAGLLMRSASRIRARRRHEVAADS